MNDRSIEARFSENRLLALFPEEIRNALLPHADIVDIEVGDVFFSQGDAINYSYFPLFPNMVSLIVDIDEDRQVEVASIGNEGAVGGIVSCGHLPAFTRSMAQQKGQAIRIPMKQIDAAKHDNRFVHDIYCRYADFLLSQVMQASACNAFHPIESRAARWLLTAQDRAGDRLELTQQAMASLLGVQRTTVNSVAKALQDQGLIRYSRGVVTVEDRETLQQRSCSCYDKLREHYGVIIGDPDNHWMSDCV